ncbi:MAG: PD40 domain-containing protein [Chloroflexi bacterium]|nr:PD40 domain-containing protein [Chloroflexota bacterium]
MRQGKIGLVALAVASLMLVLGGVADCGWPLTAEGHVKAQAPTPRPGVWLITPAPTPRDVFEAATRIVGLRQELTRLATAEGRSYRLVTTTFTPAPLVITNTPTPGNARTATYAWLWLEAVAATTGTPTPLPSRVVTASPQPTTTPTPLYVLLADREALALYLDPTHTPSPTPRAVPQALVGKIAFRSYLLGGRRGQGRILLAEPDGSRLAYLLDPWAYEVSCERELVSPDGRSAVYQNKGAHGLDLFLTTNGVESGLQLTFVGSGKAYDMAWAPDGQRIAYASNQEGDDDIFVVEIPGSLRSSPRSTKLTQDDGWPSDKHPSFSPDGRQIVFHSNRTGLNQIWVMNADGSGLRQLEVDAECWNPVWIKGWR